LGRIWAKSVQMLEKDNSPWVYAFALRVTLKKINLISSLLEKICVPLQGKIKEPQPSTPFI
jgi:hypothetical protein